MNILITGATGLIGSALLNRLAGEGHSMFCLSRSSYGGCGNVKWIEHDLVLDPWGAIPPFSIDVVYHLAGQTSTYRARSNPLVDASVNVMGILNLMEYCRNLPRPPFLVNAGTATEVGLAAKLPITEDEPDRPITFYDISKLAAEMYLMQYVREGWLRGCSLRFANVFGRRTQNQQADRGVIDKVFGRALAGETITIYGDGLYVRDYLFIDDAVDALILAAKHADRTNGRHFCIGTGHGTQLVEAFGKVIALATELTGLQVPFEHVAPPTDLSLIEHRNAVIDSKAFREATGWVPKYDFDEALSAAYRPLAG